jgi:hypothetical protein
MHSQSKDSRQHNGSVQMHQAHGARKMQEVVVVEQSENVPVVVDKKAAALAEKKAMEQQYSIIEQVVMQGDLGKLTSEQRVMYMRKVCESAGLNPFTKPFEYIYLNGKLTLYAKKDATEQLRKVNGISIEKLEEKIIDGLYIVKATARTKDGRTDESTGVVNIENLRGDAKANAIMKAETKAKRRVTLSISGMGWVDESEVDSIAGARPVQMDHSTGELIGQETKPQEAKPIAYTPSMTPSEIDKLTSLLNECDKDYVKNVYSYLQREYKTMDLRFIPGDLYDRMTKAACKNIQERQQREKEQRDAIIELNRDLKEAKAKSEAEVVNV